MKDNSLHNDSGFKAPKEYFNSFEDKLFSRLNLEDQQDPLSLPNETGFSIPDDYFNNLEEQILTQVAPVKKGKVINLFNRKQLLRAASIAAVLLVGVFLFNRETNGISGNETQDLSFDNLDIATFEEYLDSGSIDLNAYELADLYEIETEDLENINTSSTIEDGQLYEYLSDEIHSDDLIDTL